MKRRSFIQLSLYSGAAITISFFGCGTGSEVANKPWVQPQLLSHICDARTVREIGASYRQRFNSENHEKQLINILLTDSTNKIVPLSSEDTLINSLLEQKIQKDFETGNTVIIRGWILSVTEARQCALFSLTKN
ncbi:MAG TPA: hypothetical protein VGQ53_19990 [Chitinophagaceae bacterium]|jgi:hypothetical protein|nr:hypothetical protein [Chitinophagaceae bacterium]